MEGGNIGSLVNMFKHIGAKVLVASKAEDILEDTALVLPGVGHFGHAAEKTGKERSEKLCFETC